MSDTPGSDERQTEVIDGTTGKVDPAPGSFGKGGRRIDLSNLRDVRIELARLYRMVDAEEITATDGSRRAFVLKTVHDVMVSAELEARLQALEGRAGGQLGNGSKPHMRGLPPAAPSTRTDH